MSNARLKLTLNAFTCLNGWHREGRGETWSVGQKKKKKKTALYDGANLFNECRSLANKGEETGTEDLPCVKGS